MTFGAETISRVGDEKRLSLVLSSSLPAVLIEGPGRVRVLSGTVVSAEVDDGELDPFAQVGPTVNISAGEERVFVRVGREHAGLQVTWTP